MAQERWGLPVENDTELAIPESEDLSEALPDHRVFDRKELLTNVHRGIIIISLDAIDGIEILVSTQTYIARHLRGRLPLWETYVENGQRLYQLRFWVEDASDRTQDLVVDFARAILRFLSLAPSTPAAAWVETPQEFKSRSTPTI